jgi:hypothetical protein
MKKITHRSIAIKLLENKGKKETLEASREKQYVCGKQ